MGAGLGRGPVAAETDAAVLVEHAGQRSSGHPAQYRAPISRDRWASCAVLTGQDGDDLFLFGDGGATSDRGETSLGWGRAHQAHRGGAEWSSDGSHLATQGCNLRLVQTPSIRS